MMTMMRVYDIMLAEPRELSSCLLASRISSKCQQDMEKVLSEMRRIVKADLDFNVTTIRAASCLGDFIRVLANDPEPLDDPMAVACREVLKKIVVRIDSLY